ncbi:MAG: hypothetical protein VCA17_00810 [Dehalococcoidia bacterium]
MTISDIRLMRLHADILFVHDTAGRLLYVNESVDPEDYPAPIIYVGRTQEGTVYRCRWDVPEVICFQTQDTVNLFGTLNMTEHRGLVSELKDVVRSHAEVGNVWSGLAHRFHDVVEVSSCNVFVDRSNSELLGGGFDDIIPELEVAPPCVVLVVDGRAVSICRSVRKSAVADEAGVETLPEYRQRGFAISVVGTWASIVHGAGRIRLYSTAWSNTASQGLAAKLGLIMYGTDLHISKR